MTDINGNIVTDSEMSVGSEIASDSVSMASTVVTVNVTGQNMSFSPNEIKVKKGDTIKVVFTSGDMLHDFVVDEFNARTKQLKTGETETIEFVADKTGMFEYYCSVGEHRERGMVGKLIVE
jgi:plastocyanin